MATLTQTHVLECEDAAEFAAFQSQLNAYQADQNNPQIDRIDDEPNLTITYSWVGTKTPNE